MKTSLRAAVRFLRKIFTLTPSECSCDYIWWKLSRKFSCLVSVMNSEYKYFIELIILWLELDILMSLPVPLLPPHPFTLLPISSNTSTLWTTLSVHPYFNISYLPINLNHRRTFRTRLRRCGFKRNSTNSNAPSNSDRSRSAHAKIFSVQLDREWRGRGHVDVKFNGKFHGNCPV